MTLSEALHALTLARDDAESWRQQADSRITDALQFAAERDELRAALEEIETRTRADGDMADAAVNVLASAALAPKATKEHSA